MAANSKPEIVLYDLACTKNVCFSPVVWRIRIMLNYKRIPYKTVFLEFQEIEPTLKGFGIPSPESAAGYPVKYTVPAIHHVPTNTYMMDSDPISKFIEANYPEPPIPLASELGAEIEKRARATAQSTFLASVMPREIHILAPEAQEYFRRTREAYLGHKLEDLIADPEKEEAAWAAVHDEQLAINEMITTNKAEGPFVLGAQMSYTDLFITGFLQCAKVITEEVFQRLVKYEGYRQAYDACQPYMEKQD